jgi:hypothetical protein
MRAKRNASTKTLVNPIAGNSQEVTQGHRDSKEKPISSALNYCIRKNGDPRKVVPGFV